MDLLVVPVHTGVRQPVQHRLEQVVQIPAPAVWPERLDLHPQGLVEVLRSPLDQHLICDRLAVLAAPARDQALEEGVDWIAVSFVQRPDDIAEVKKIARGRAMVLAKIEKPQAIARLDEIMEVSDALMVARGDLGVEMPLEKVPGLQKRITRMARRLGKPVVVATQMLESMITSPVPTRAEVSDVATAVFEGADAVMLSAESAAGQYPVEAVSTMNRIAEEVEQDSIYRTVINAQRSAPEATGADAIAVFWKVPDVLFDTFTLRITESTLLGSNTELIDNRSILEIPS